MIRLMTKYPFSEVRRSQSPEYESQIIVICLPCTVHFMEAEGGMILGRECCCVCVGIRYTT
jgi:hypothetical protein